MIHISSNFYLTSIPLFGNPLIGYNSILGFSGVVATDTASGSSILNLVNNNTYQYWVSDATAEQFITIQNPDINEVDYIGIARHNFGSGQILYQVQGSDNGTDWDDITDEKIPQDDRAILEYFDVTQYSIYRLRLDPSSITPPRIAHIKIGKILIMPRCIRAPHSPITLSRETNVITNTSENGNYIGRVQLNQFLKSQYEFQSVRRDYYEQHIDPFSRHAILDTFFVAWKPDKYPLDVAYAWVEKGQDISFRYDNDNGMGSLSFTAIAVS